MKILMISMFAPHFFNWTEQLRDSGHEIHWLDVFDSNTPVEQINFVDQIIGWRFKWKFPGRYFLKRNIPALYKWINKINEVSFERKLETEIERIKPDAIHFFVMYISGVRSLDLIKKFPEIKWIYTAWGSDMYYYSQLSGEQERMREVLPLVDFMFADCSRDFRIAKENGFKGISFGPFPGGGGFDLESLDQFSTSNHEREIILIKGYQGLHGRCISVLKAILWIKNDLKDFQIVVFGASKEVFDFIRENKKGFKEVEVYGILPREKVLKLMGRSKIYIGNSCSDGIPNTLLEAIVLGAFPIQSDPGGASSEIVKHNENGFVISDPENPEEIKQLIKAAIENPELIERARSNNHSFLRPRFEREKIKKEVLNCYSQIERQI